ncbi:MAG: proline dehydrogenase family protein [Acidobacteriota bacterium]
MSVARNLLLAASTNVWLRDRAMRARFVKRSVARFMPGERIEDAMSAALRQHSQGIGSILAHLGENVTTGEEAEAVTQHYLDVLDRLGDASLDAQVSIKPTQLGLDLDKGLCQHNVQRLVDRAAELRRLLWIDMENARYVDATLDLFRRMRRRSPFVGLALQACLYRTERDLESLLPLGAALRLVKGAYLEPANVAYPRKTDVDQNYYRLASRILGEYHRTGALLHIATHDTALIDRLTPLIAAVEIPPTAYEFAMLYGIQVPLQHRLVATGRRVRVLISYGEHWFPWYLRRLAERPANVWFVVKQLFV